MSRVLIVDNESSNVDALRLDLKDRNPSWDILAAYDEKEAEAILEKEDIDLIVTDLVLVSEQGGMRILKAARQKDPLVMVILFTGYEKKLDRYRAYELGAFDCIVKNVVGINTSEEINVKAHAALRVRRLALDQIEMRQRMGFLQRYFDPRIFRTIEQDKRLLDLRVRTVTICFWDIRGFSRLCEALKTQPGLIAGFLRDYFETASEVIFSKSGVLDKFIGDGVMGLFGALGETRDEGRQDAENAVESALGIRQRLEGVLKSWIEKWVLYTPQLIDIGLGCGIHTGVETLVGNVGTETRDQYTALGPHVNLAARLGGMANKGQILVSSTTEARVKGKFILDRIAVISDVKNITGEFPIFSVIR